MARYIDADRLIDDGWMLERHGISNKLLQVMSIADVPTADVVEVVRCKDCKYGEVDDADFPDQYLCHHSGDNWNNGNHFCAFGTPKERGEEECK